MAQKVQIILEDDLDGSEATETVAFGLDGSQYEIDLNDKHAAAFRKAMEKYIEKGRRTVARRGRPRAASTAPKTGATRKRVTTMEEIEASKSK